MASSNVISSKVVWNCLETLKELSWDNVVALILTLAYNGVEGKKLAGTRKNRALVTAQRK